MGRSHCFLGTESKVVVSKDGNLVGLTSVLD